MSKKSSLRPSNSAVINDLGSPDYMSSSPEKSSPDKLAPSSGTKIFKGAINKYQAHIVEENDDEEENDTIEENTNLNKSKSPFYEEPAGLSLQENAKEKQMAMRARTAEKKISMVLGKAFKNSGIINEKEANLLYLNLPGILQNDTELIFSLNRDKTFDNLEKILQTYRCPMVVILSYGQERFGGYASEAWDLQKARYVIETIFII